MNILYWRDLKCHISIESNSFYLFNFSILGFYTRLIQVETSKRCLLNCLTITIFAFLILLLSRFSGYVILYTQVYLPPSNCAFWKVLCNVFPYPIYALTYTCLTFILPVLLSLSLPGIFVHPFMLACKYIILFQVLFRNTT